MTGTIRKRGRRSWEVRFDVGRDAATGRRRFRYLRLNGTKRDAQRALTDALHQHDTGTDVTPSRVTVREFLHRWLSDHAARRPRSRATGRLWDASSPSWVVSGCRSCAPRTSRKPTLACSMTVSPRAPCYTITVSSAGPSNRRCAGRSSRGTPRTWSLRRGRRTERCGRCSQRRCASSLMPARTLTFAA